MMRKYDPDAEERLAAIRRKAKGRWRLIALAIVLALLWLFYTWGFADGMARMGYVPGATLPKRSN